VEGLAGIPGTVGGGICMNCGGRYGEIGMAVKQVRVVGSDGQIYDRDHDDLEFGYRRCALGGEFVVSATFGLSEIDPGELLRRFRRIWMYKQNTQPPLGTRSVGCIFRNPNGQSAGALIDQAGLKGLRVGKAYVSDRHANFILAESGSRASEVRELIDLIRTRVEEHHGIGLEPEVEIW
jgi:UDP-N-acetylmuramate dehydrogenase